MVMETDSARPRAFYPDFVEQAPPAATPGWDRNTEQRMLAGKTLAKGLGWFSIALGVAELIMPDRLAKFLGVDEERAGLIQAYGLREIASGVTILAQRDPKTGVWSRIAGDAVDLGSLGAVLAGSEKKGAVLGAAAAVAGVTAMDVLAAKQLARHEKEGEL